MKKILLFSLLSLPLLFLGGCSLNQNNDAKISELEQQLSGLVEQISGLQTENENLKETLSLKYKQESISGTIIETNISDTIKNELELLYGYNNIRLSNIFKAGNYIIADADNGSEQPGGLFLIVAGKINNKWVSFYEGNSGEISCNIVNLFGFPKELLKAYNPNNFCYEEGAEYTIPEKTMNYINNQKN